MLKWIGAFVLLWIVGGVLLLSTPSSAPARAQVDPEVHLAEVYRLGQFDTEALREGRLPRTYQSLSVSDQRMYDRTLNSIREEYSRDEILKNADSQIAQRRRSIGLIGTAWDVIEVMLPFSGWTVPLNYDQIVPLPTSIQLPGDVLLGDVFRVHSMQLEELPPYLSEKILDNTAEAAMIVRASASYTSSNQATRNIASLASTIGGLGVAMCVLLLLMGRTRRATP